MAIGGQAQDCENVEADMIVPDDGFQIRHKEFGLYQGSCMRMGFWYPMSEMPEQGICRFPAYEDAEEYITFLCLDADCHLRHGDLIIEPFDAELNIRLMKVGRLKNTDYCQNEN